MFYLYLAVCLILLVAFAHAWNDGRHVLAGVAAGLAIAISVTQLDPVWAWLL